MNSNHEKGVKMGVSHSEETFYEYGIRTNRFVWTRENGINSLEDAKADAAVSILKTFSNNNYKTPTTDENEENSI